MIISKESEVTLNSANFKHFISLGYSNLKKGEKLIVPVENLSEGSHSIVRVKCDVCGIEKDLMYRYYAKSCKNYNFYVCPKCSRMKAKLTSLNKFGVEFYSKTDEYKNRAKETNIKNCGVDNVSKCEIIKEKRKKTMLERHGVEYYVLNENFKMKCEETSMKNYGVPHPQMSKEMVEKRLEYYKKMGFHVLTNEFDLYKRKVYSLTRKVKKELMNSWDGIDYYDGQYIKNNFNLPYHDTNYPTIDHKITIFEGFKNKIDAEKIADISNLCFTKRNINSKKNIKNYKTYLGAAT